LREFTTDAADLTLIYQLLNEPKFIRFVADRNIRTLDDARDYLVKRPIASYAANGFGLWCVLRKDNGALIGMCGLIRRDNLPEVDIGYALLEAHEGHGFATEAAAAALTYGRDLLKLQRIVAIVDPANTASVRVLEKIGLRYERSVKLDDDDVELKLFG
jgi:RimJ/RimL family protein N-acetyltransferase